MLIEQYEQNSRTPLEQLEIGKLKAHYAFATRLTAWMGRLAFPVVWYLLSFRRSCRTKGSKSISKTFL